MGVGGHATYNGRDFDHVSPTVALEPQMEGGALVRYVKRISFRAHVLTSTWANWLAARNAIDAALQVPNQTLTIYDLSSNTKWSFSSADCIGGNGPYVRYSYEPLGDYSFYVNVEIYGDIQPSGSGTIVDSYTDTYDYDQQDRKTYTRRGTQRSASAYSSVDTALDGVDPAPSGNWEYLDRSGTLDEDGKGLEYQYRYIEYFEALPSGFASLDYRLQRGRDGRKDALLLTATAGIEHGRSVDGLVDNLIQWAKSKLPSGSKITAPVQTDFDKRNGQCSISLTAISPRGGDIIEEEQTLSRTRATQFVIRHKLGGGGSWKQPTGDPVTIETVSGRATGLSAYPPRPGEWDEFTIDYLPPFKGDDGDMLFTITYTNQRTLVSGDTPSGPGGGGGGGTPTPGSPFGSAPRRGGGSILIGDIGTFSSFGLSGASFGTLTGPFGIRG